MLFFGGRPRPRFSCLSIVIGRHGRRGPAGGRGYSTIDKWVADKSSDGAPPTTGCGIAGVTPCLCHVDGCATVTFGVATPDSVIQFFS